MKKFTIAIMLLTISLFTAANLLAYSTITIPGTVSSMTYYGGEYVGPISANLDGKTLAGGITCIDFNSITYIPNYVGFAVTVETLSPVSLASAKFLQADTTQLLKYEQAAWLNTQIQLTKDAGQIGAIQFAMWELFAGNAAGRLSANQQNDVNAWLAKADSIDPTQYDFSSIKIFTPTDSLHNQEFITGSVSPAAPVPEPSTSALLGIGLLGIAIYSKRKYDAQRDVF